MSEANGDTPQPEEAVPDTPRSAVAPHSNDWHNLEIPTDLHWVKVLHHAMLEVDGLLSNTAHEVAKGFATISSDHREMRYRVDELHTQLMILTADVEVAKVARRAMTDSQDALGKSIDYLAGEVRNSSLVVSASVDRLGARVDALAERFEAVSQRVTLLERRDSDRARALDAVEDKVENTGRHLVSAAVAKAKQFDELAVDELQKRRAWGRGILAGVILTIVSALIGWATGRSERQAPPIHQEEKP